MFFVQGVFLPAGMPHSCLWECIVPACGKTPFPNSTNFHRIWQCYAAWLF